MRQGFIYFIRPVGHKGPIKIGCSRVPEHRLQSLMSWSPFKLEIVGTIKGDFDLEKNIHECFAADHSHHEWFDPSDRLVAFVEKVLSGTPVHEATDLSNRTKIPTAKSDPKIRKRTSYAHRLGHAERKLKPGWSMPLDVMEIMWRWRGWCPGEKFPAEEPTEAELARLDEVFSRPMEHAVRKSKVAA